MLLQRNNSRAHTCIISISNFINWGTNRTLVARWKEIVCKMKWCDKRILITSINLLLCTNINEETLSYKATVLRNSGFSLSLCFIQKAGVSLTVTLPTKGNVHWPIEQIQLNFKEKGHFQVSTCFQEFHVAEDIPVTPRRCFKLVPGFRKSTQSEKCIWQPKYLFIYLWYHLLCYFRLAFEKQKHWSGRLASSIALNDSW